jgi:hypothetical protein
MAFWVTGWAMAGAIIGGISVYNSSQNVAKKQEQSMADAQAASLASMKSVQPSVSKAEDEAAKNVEKQRRMRALSGGKTLLSTESLGSSTAQGTAPKTLLGN